MCAHKGEKEALKNWHTKYQAAKENDQFLELTKYRMSCVQKSIEVEQAKYSELDKSYGRGVWKQKNLQAKVDVAYKKYQECVEKSNLAHDAVDAQDEKIDALLENQK